MTDFYIDWCDEVRNLLSYVPDGEVMEWTLNTHRPLPAWHENKVVLVGDACHPMLPYVALGAAQAIEYAGVLQCFFAKLSADVPLALDIYDEVRKFRGESIQLSAGVTKRALHLKDGPLQQERDQKIRAAARDAGDNPDLWADKTFQEFMWGKNVMRDTIVRWPEWKARAEGTHLHGLAAVAYT